MKPDFTVIDYSTEYQTFIRRILAKIGWAEQYVASAEPNMHTFSLSERYLWGS